MPNLTPKSNPLEALRRHLQQTFVNWPMSPENFEHPEVTERLRAVVRTHDSPMMTADHRTLSTALTEFRQSGRVTSFRDLKYVCLGACLRDEQDECVLADDRLLSRLLKLADEAPSSRHQLKCFQSLLHGYWSFPLNDPETGDDEKRGWEKLRAWLEIKRQTAKRMAGRKPAWVDTLLSHPNLLTDDPCSRYGKALLEGAEIGLREAMDGLGIPSASWVMEEAVFAQMRMAAGFGDKQFTDLLHRLLPIALGKGELALSDQLKRRCVAVLISRYARCGSTPEHIALRDAAVALIGNPWLRRAAWDADVLDKDGHPDVKAREMVNGWLKRRLVTDFFELLSEDGTGDRRRLDYWLRFEPFIEDMWFALGTDARRRRGESFDHFRRRARGRLLDLEQTSPDNNAFVMRIGGYLAVEFAVKGNACFLFHWDALPEHLSRRLMSGRERDSISIHALRLSTNRLIHRDKTIETWEQQFDTKIIPLTGRRPTQPPHTHNRSRQQTAPSGHGSHHTHATQEMQIHNLLKELMLSGVRIVDNRAKGGALWVTGGQISPSQQSKLQKLGFRYKNSKGWWRE